MYSLPAFVLGAIFSAVLVRCDQTPCYWANGTQTNENSMACGDGMSHCCQKGESCISNGLCFSPAKGIPYRGACTVQDWVARNTSACPTWCSDWNNGWGWADIAFCGPATGGLGGFSYWCSNAPHTPSTRCQNPLYQWPKALNNAALTVSQIPVNPTDIIGSNDTITAGGAPKKQLDWGLGVGLGLGLPLLLALGALVYLFVQNRKMQRTHSMVLSQQFCLDKADADGKWQGQYIQINEASGTPSEIDTIPLEADGNPRSELSERQFSGPVAERSRLVAGYETRAFHSH